MSFLIPSVNSDTSDHGRLQRESSPAPSAPPLAVVEQGETQEVALTVRNSSLMNENFDYNQQGKL